ncbi:MAG: hypothetical protein HMLKMBBP_00624 [Planctomycetes bacterium]|nr:hypothetical protein [Planctomycetota bacterium]
MKRHTRGAGTPRTTHGTIRRSFALPRALVDQVAEAAPPDYGSNLNAVVRRVLEDYVARRRSESLDAALDAMAADPAVRAAAAEIESEFDAFEARQGREPEPGPAHGATASKSARPRAGTERPKGRPVRRGTP